MTGRIPLRPSRVRDALGTGHRFAADVRTLGIVTSTSDLLLDLARRGGADGTVLAADAQTAGRGRRGRTWFAPPNTSLLFSVLLRRLPPEEHRPLLSVTVGVALAEALEPLGLPVSLKWPNDVLVGDRKVAGILVDLGDAGDHGAFAVIGVGINDNLTLQDLPRDTPTPAGSLSLLSGSPVDREALLGRALTTLAARLADLENGKIGPLVEAFLGRDALAGRRCVVRAGDAVHEGVCVEAHPLEGLLLRTDDDQEVRVPAAHAQLLRVER